MKPARRMWSVLVVMLLAGVSAAHAQIGTVAGEVMDVEGKPLGGVTVTLKSDGMGASYDATTDKSGHFLLNGVRPGAYKVSLKARETVLMTNYPFRVSSGDNKLVLNLKEIREQVEKDNAAMVAERKKREEDASKFDTMKAHFDTGKAALDQIRTTREEMQRAPADQRAPLQAKLDELNRTAVTELEAAQKAAPEKDSNRHILAYNLGKAYESAGRYEEAAAQFQQAGELKPTQPEYFMEAGTALARSGKVDEAGQQCDKALATNPAIGAACWRNVGIVLQNGQKMKESAAPLKRATELDPNNAQGWFLLGRALVNAMDFKMQGDKVIPVMQPGTVEAYQKAVELDPNGPYGQQAKQGLAELEAMGLGIQTKVKAGKKKS
jgi:tetratricopeptide (TPR) repeat protein